LAFYLRILSIPPTRCPYRMPEPTNEKARAQHAIAWALNLTSGAHPSPHPYEQRLLAEYQRKEISLDEFMQRLETCVFQIIYRSRVATPPTEADIRHLLDAARTYNELHYITGLLVYGNRQYVQVLEGDEQEVGALFARIARDPRHEQVELLSTELMPQRRFADWAMDFGHVDEAALQCLLHQWRMPPWKLKREPRLQALAEAYQLLD
jgi:hypothetical protein